MQVRKIQRARGEITVPGDKSISHRGVMLGALCGGRTEISGFLMGADCLSTIDCFRKMGVQIDVENNHVTVYGRGLHGLKKPAGTLYTGNSGTTTRLLCGLLAGQNFDAVITGDASVCKRPMGRVTRPLSEMGAKIRGEYCPLAIAGAQLHGMDYTMAVASAQVKSAIILAGLYAQGETIVREIEKSRDHTERMLSAMGADIQTEGLTITVSPVQELITPGEILVPGDISSAAFFLVLGSVLPGSEVTVRNVGMNPTRTGIMDVLQAMGARISIQNMRTANGEPVADLTVKSAELRGTEIGGALIPRLIDELPVLAVAAAFAQGVTVIRDAAELKVKETNRIRAVVDEFGKCGVDIAETADGMIIRGGRPLHGAKFSTYGDHRMAMSLTVLAQLAQGESSLDDGACVDVSYPSFFSELDKLGR